MHLELPEFFSRTFPNLMLLHASSPADIGCESEIVSPLSPILALGEAGFLPVASPECHHQKTVYL